MDDRKTVTVSQADACNPKGDHNRGAFLARLVICLFVSSVLAVIAEKIYTYLSWGIGYQIDSSGSITMLRLLILLASGFALCLLIVGGHTAGRAFHRWRWVIGGCFVVFCTIFKLSGSSINSFYILYGADNPMRDVVLGWPRASRADEFAVNTLFAFSQTKNAFQQNNLLLGGVAPTDVAIIKDAPVLGIVELFRPFQWGYLVFGAERGLAFYWSSRLAVLFLISYEFFRLVSRTSEQRENRVLAVVGSVLITFSPLIQWWFAVNNIVEMLVAVFGSIVCLHQYLSNHHTFIRCLWGLAICECAGMFIWSLYPAWQAPLLWVLLVLAIWVIKEHWSTIRMTRADWIVAACLVVVFAMLSCAVAYLSKDTILAMLNTSYPGARRSQGGDRTLLKRMFGDIGSQMGLSNPDATAVESSRMLDFFPLGIVLVVSNIIFKKNNRKIDWLSLALGVICVIMFAFIVIGLPSWMAGLTLLNMSVPNRVFFAFGVVNIILLIRAISTRTWSLKLPVSVFVAFVFAILNTCLALYSYGDFLALPRLRDICCVVLMYVESLAMGILCTTDFQGLRMRAKTMAVRSDSKAIEDRSENLVDNGMTTRQKVHCLTVKVSVVAVAGIVSIFGAMINPVQHGANAVFSQPAIVALQKMVSNERGMVAVVSEDGVSMSSSSMLADLVAANGIPAINTVQVTPRWELWKKLDPHGDCYYQYNRYAFINISATDEKTSLKERIENPAGDQVHVKLTAAELHSLGVTYVISNDDLSQYHDGEYKYIQVSKKYGPLSVWEIVREKN